MMKKQRTHPYILATDLDGTFLGGSKEAREKLYRAIEKQKEAIKLIFVTGRDLDFIREIVEKNEVPRPDYIIGDIGTTVVDGQTFSPFAPIEQEIAAKWQNAAEQVRQILDHVTGLSPQPGNFRYRMSYYYDPAVFDRSVLAEIEALGLDWLMSADLYLDVLPKGVAKGSTLLRVLEHLRLSHEQVVCAGDTLNDWSLFETGLPGIVVGNAEPLLLQRTSRLPHLYHSKGHGAEGILEGLAYFGYGEWLNHE
jgi:HAD superfamily hydrolase (TIGR01484 family)